MKRYFNIICIVALLLQSCGADTPDETVKEQKPEDTNLVQLTPAQLKNAGIQTAAASRQTIATTLRVNGVMEAPPQNMISVSVPLGGYLKKTSLLPGMHLNKGQLMAEIEDQAYIQLQQDYLTAKARLTYLEQEYNRQRDLNQSKATSDKVFQQTQSDYRSQLVTVRSLAEKLRMIGVNPNRLSAQNLTRTLRLYSPIDGYVTEVNVNIGTFVEPTDVLFELVDPRDLHLMLTVFEKDLDKLQIGQKVIAYRANQPEKKYLADIIYIGKNVAGDRAVEVHCHLDKADASLVPGMFMNAEIEVENEQAYALPEEAIVRFGSKQYVFAARDSSIFEMLEVMPASSKNGFTALQPSQTINPEKERYVTKGAYSLLMKLKNKEEE